MTLFFILQAWKALRVFSIKPAYFNSCLMFCISLLSSRGILKLMKFCLFSVFFLIWTSIYILWKPTGVECQPDEDRTRRDRISAGGSCHHCRLTIGEVVGQKIVFHCCMKTEYSWYKHPNMYLRLFYCSCYIRFPKGKCWHNLFRSSHLFRNSLPLHSASAISRIVEVVIYSNIGGILPSKMRRQQKLQYHGMINVILSSSLCCAKMYLFFQ